MLYAKLKKLDLWKKLGFVSHFSFYQVGWIVDSAFLSTMPGKIWGCWQWDDALPEKSRVSFKQMNMPSWSSDPTSSKPSEEDSSLTLLFFQKRWSVLVLSSTSVQGPHFPRCTLKPCETQTLACHVSICFQHLSNATWGEVQCSMPRRLGVQDVLGKRSMIWKLWWSRPGNISIVW